MRVFWATCQRQLRFLVLSGLGIGVAIAVWLLHPLAINGAADPGRLVDILTVNPRIQLDMPYATTNNFTLRKLYTQARCLLRAETAERLSQVQIDLETQNLGLQVYDCYRPLSVQKLMWKLVPDDRFVANPVYGSRHNRGSAVDITLVDHKSKELNMPSEFDNFSIRSSLNYSGGSAESRNNRQILQTAMKKRGFLPLQTEWWHFDDPHWKQYSVMDISLESVKN